jgi:acetyl-CoA carboxylase biotin carboxyl carrier protein
MADDRGSAEGGIEVDTDLVRQLAALLNESDLSEIEVQDGARRIVVKRKLAAAPGPSVHYAPAPSPAAPAAASAAAPAPVVAPADAAAHPGAVKSPMVGTVYLSAEPGSKPFVAPGAKVSAGDTLVIVEAMKVMNPITAPRAGTVREILVQDAQPVEYDQPLLIVE